MMPSSTMTLKFRPDLGLSDETFWGFCRANPDLRLERTADGELVIMAPAGSDSGRVNSRLNLRVGAWSERANLGEVFDSSAGFTLPNGAIRSPDAAWMTRERWDALPRDDQIRFAHVTPDFVAELRSVSDEMSKLRGKMQEYIEQGARLGWLIDPESGTVEIYRPDRPVETLNRPEVLSGEGVLPGFVLVLKGILFD
jgi:Uma2 family endonuclease